MQLIGIPTASGTDVHKATCKDIGSEASHRGLTYDDCSHFEASRKSEIREAGEVHIFPCVRLPK